MTAASQHFSIIVGDIEKFGRRTDPVQQELRERMYTAAHAAFAEAGVDIRDAPDPADRGDGFFWLLPGGVDKVALTGRFVEKLNAELRSQAATHRQPLRMRVALHLGQVAQDGQGWVGTELNTACRLVDTAPLRTALEAAERAQLALAVSEAWYGAVVRHDHSGIDPSAYRRVPFDAKEIQGAHAWIYVPGYSFPPGIGDQVAGPGSAGAEAHQAAAKDTVSPTGVPAVPGIGTVSAEKVGMIIGTQTNTSPVFNLGGGD